MVMRATSGAVEVPKWLALDSTPRCAGAGEECGEGLTGRKRSAVPARRERASLKMRTLLKGRTMVCRSV